MLRPSCVQLLVLRPRFPGMWLLGYQEPQRFASSRHLVCSSASDAEGSLLPNSHRPEVGSQQVFVLCSTQAASQGH